MKIVFAEYPETRNRNIDTELSYMPEGTSELPPLRGLALIASTFIENPPIHLMSVLYPHSLMQSIPLSVNSYKKN